MNIQNKKALYESIMKSVAKTVKQHLNESETSEDYVKRMNERINNWIENAIHTNEENKRNKIKFFIFVGLQKYKPYSAQVNKLVQNKTSFKDLSEDDIKTALSKLEVLWDTVGPDMKINCIKDAENSKTGKFLLDKKLIDKFDESVLTNEGQDTTVSFNDWIFFLELINSDDYKNTVKNSKSLKLLFKFLNQPRILGNKEYTVDFFTSLVTNANDLLNNK